MWKVLCVDNKVGHNSKVHNNVTWSRIRIYNKRARTDKAHVIISSKRTSIGLLWNLLWLIYLCAWGNNFLTLFDIYKKIFK
jgi:hypothetical protein